MLLMLENQVAATGSKDKNNRSIIVKWKFHGTFLKSHHHARAAASRCSSLRTTQTYKTSNNILESNYFANKLSNN